MKIRESARLILVNERDEVFLFRHEDRAGRDQDVVGPRQYWVMPGGGLEPGESWDAAAIRELWEETGITGVTLGPWVWARRKDVVFLGQPTRGFERYYLVRVEGVTVDSANQFDHECEVYQQHRWWTLTEIADSDEIFFPDGLATLLAPLLAGEIPPTPLALFDP